MLSRLRLVPAAEDSEILCGAHEVQVWVVNHAMCYEYVERLWGCLDSAERDRARRFRSLRRRSEYILARGAAKDLLGQQLGLSPGQVQLGAGQWGKPFVSGAPLFLSISHSEVSSFVAVYRRGEVGIDCEAASPALSEAAPAFLTPREREQLEDAKAGDEQALLLSLWTRKEALLKATGRGLGLDPRSVDVAKSDTINLPDADGAWRPWTVRDFEFCGQEGAIAVGGESFPSVSLRVWGRPHC